MSNTIGPQTRSIVGTPKFASTQKITLKFASVEPQQKTDLAVFTGTLSPKIQALSQIDKAAQGHIQALSKKRSDALNAILQGHETLMSNIETIYTGERDELVTELNAKRDAVVEALNVEYEAAVNSHHQKHVDLLDQINQTTKEAIAEAQDHGDRIKLLLQKLKSLAELMSANIAAPPIPKKAVYDEKSKAVYENYTEQVLTALQHLSAEKDEKRKLADNVRDALIAGNRSEHTKLYNSLEALKQKTVTLIENQPMEAVWPIYLDNYNSEAERILDSAQFKTWPSGPDKSASTDNLHPCGQR
jgi:hypothetical protein